MMGGILREFANLNNHLLGKGNVGKGALRGLVDYVGAIMAGIFSTLEGRKRRYNICVLVKSVSSFFNFRKITSLKSIGIKPVSIAEQMHIF